MKESNHGRAGHIKSFVECVCWSSLRARRRCTSTEVPFLFERHSERMGRAVVASFASHALAVVVALLAIRYGPRTVATAPLLPFQANSQIIWLSQPGPGGGGGGGGNRMVAPPRQAEEPGKDKITVPVTKPPKLEPPKQATKEPEDPG